MRHVFDEPVQIDRAGALERALIAEYLERLGYTRELLSTLPELTASALMKQASLYASARLAEVEARAHYVHEIHDVTHGSES